MIAHKVFSSFCNISEKIFEKYDAAVIQRRSRSKKNFDSKYLCQFTFQLLSKTPGGFGCASLELNELLAVKDARSYAASSICEARKKFPPQLFLDLNRELVVQVPAELRGKRFFTGQGDRKIFAVDGSKMIVPIGLKKSGFKVEKKECHYPVGRASCLLDVGTQLIHDVSLTSHGDERKAALAHFPHILPGDIVIYDRGYFAFKLIGMHASSKSDFIMRVADKIGVKEIDTFITRNKNNFEADTEITICPEGVGTLQRLKKAFPGQETSFKLRIVKYTYNDTSYYVLTSLLDKESLTLRVLSDLYHARWGVEEIYKQMKTFTLQRTFHGTCQRTVRQEVFASALLLNIGRIFSLQAEYEKKTMPKKIKDKLISDTLLFSVYSLPSLFLM